MGNDNSLSSLFLSYVCVCATSDYLDLRQIAKDDSIINIKDVGIT
jgi:hypothetical protein